MDFAKEKNFMNFIKFLINPNSNPEKIAMINKLAKVADDVPGENILYLDDFVKSNTPLKQVAENIEVIPNVAKMFAKEGKTLNIVDFVNNNTNLY